MAKATSSSHLMILVFSSVSVRNRLFVRCIALLVLFFAHFTIFDDWMWLLHTVFSFVQQHIFSHLPHLSSYKTSCNEFIISAKSTRLHSKKSSSRYFCKIYQCNECQMIFWWLITTDKSFNFANTKEPTHKNIFQINWNKLLCHRIY